MEFEYLQKENQILLENLKNEVIRKTLAYMVDFKEHENLVTVQKPYSIEISNPDICIAVIFFVGFVGEEYEVLKTKRHYHIVSFHKILQTMHEFESIPIKYLDYMALFFMSLGRTNDETIKDFLHLKNLYAHQTVLHLRKEYILKKVVWNHDLFSLIFHKQKKDLSSNKIKENFTSSMAINSIMEADNEENLKNINSSFIQEYVKNKELLAKNEPKTDLDKVKPLLVGFAIASGNNRAKKATKLTLLPLLLQNSQFIQNTKSILVIISSHTNEITIDEIAIIVDYIQKKMGNTNIILHVAEDENLSEALALTIVLSSDK
ncbi:FtsZ/tubulin family protein [Flavobacterium gilvum]|uniref:Cell division protein FtsZ C-terminal domain-containing protein n=1 Tax=Flavobacterium gilvum TaxID=1492737 RepID=A0AAC9N4C1_9FLAO|nr:hypothetical protein [Flavobacterium gilvum]AOW10480.1 hypothetical protein EM308_13760 [Flavobacterium gilvum]KFC61140.1 hypothetical protein FEM08_00760 [Flavobacterium gilvum]